MNTAIPVVLVAGGPAETEADRVLPVSATLRPMHRLAAWSASSLLVAGALGGCGGSSGNGVASKSPDAIVTAASGAIGGVKSVHVSGSVTSGASPITLDLDLLAGQGGRGKMSENGLSFQLLEAGKFVYINASQGFWQHVGGSAAAQLFRGKWLKAPAGTGNFASFAALTNLHKLLNGLLGSHGKLAKGKTSTINGQPVLAVNDTTRGGTLYVATTGKPYPLQIQKAGQGGGRISFDRFNESVALTPPKNSIDISQLQTK